MSIVVICDECGCEANPAWGEDGGTYCTACHHEKFWGRRAHEVEPGPQPQQDEAP